jgi:hypothetical protein
LNKYPQLRGPRAANLIDKFIREAGQQVTLRGSGVCKSTATCWGSPAEIRVRKLNQIIQHAVPATEPNTQGAGR